MLLVLFLENSILDIKALTVYMIALKTSAALFTEYTETNSRQRLNELTGLLDFKDLLKRTVGKLSGGQLRKLI